MGVQKASDRGRRSIVPRALAFAALYALTPAWAQFKPLSGHEYREVIDPKRQVSGHLVVGVSLVDKAGEKQLEEIQFDGRKLSINLKGLPANARIRVDLDSPDGRFHGTGMWQLEQADTGWAELTLLDKDQPKRPRLQGGHLAILVQIYGPGQSTSPRPVAASLFPAKALDKANDTREAWLQVNSRRAQIMVKGNAGPVKCERVASASVVRFDTLCKIPLSQLKTPENRYFVSVLRRDGFAWDPPHTLELNL